MLQTQFGSCNNYVFSLYYVTILIYILAFKLAIIIIIVSITVILDLVAPCVCEGAGIGG